MLKKMTSLVVTLGLTFLLCSVSVNAQPEPVEDNQALQTAKATLIVKIGMVKIKRKDSSQEISAKKGMLLYGGDQIKTGELSRAAIILNDGTITKLHEKTNLVLAVDQEDQKNNRLKLLLGQLWAKVKKREHSLEIETPSAVAAIKGTMFELKILSDEKVELLVWNGLVDFFNAQGKVQVGASQASTAGKNNKPSTPKKIDLSKQNQWFESVVEIPAEKTLDLKIKDKNGQEQQLQINYKKK